MKGLDYTALILTITGAINWGLVGLFKFDLVAFLFGNLSWLSRIIYILVGLSGLYLCTFFSRLADTNPYAADNCEKHVPRVSHSYRGSRHGRVHARTLARYSRKT